MILVGELSLWVALLMAVWTATVSFAGGSLKRQDLIASAERGSPLISAAAGLVPAIHAFVLSRRAWMPGLRRA